MRRIWNFEFPVALIEEKAAVAASFIVAGDITCSSAL
jgi:hypothetical protein